MVLLQLTEEFGRMNKDCLSLRTILNDEAIKKFLAYAALNVSNNKVEKSISIRDGM